LTNFGLESERMAIIKAKSIDKGVGGAKESLKHERGKDFRYLAKTYLP